MVEEGLLSREDAIARIEPAQLDHLLHPMLDPTATYDVVAHGLAASPGAASGHAVFDADSAETRAQGGEDVILVRWETSPDDIHGLIAAKGILTAHGGIASHAALVARGMGKPCVAGCAELTIDLERRVATLGGHEVAEGDVITVDGSSGSVILGAVELVPPGSRRPRDDPRLGRRRPPARGARERGHARRRNEGTRVRRPGHRPLPHRAHVLRRGAPAGRPGDDPRRRRGGAPRRARPAAAVPAERLRGHLRGDGRAAGDDPAARPAAARVPAARSRRRPTSACATRIKALHEANPMLGTRGCRLGLQWPEIYEMQVRAIVRAALPCATAPAGAAGRDHAPARRLRGGAAPAARADGPNGRGGGLRPPPTWSER